MKYKIIFMLFGLFFLLVSFKRGTKADFKTAVTTSRRDTAISPLAFGFIKAKAAGAKTRFASNNNETAAPVPDATFLYKPALTEPLITSTTDADLAARARAEMQAYLDTLIIEPKSIGLIRNAKAVINNNAVSRTIGSTTGFNGSMLAGNYTPGNINPTDSFSDPADPDNGAFLPMGTWDHAGVPAYLETTPDIISPQLLHLLKTSLAKKANGWNLHRQFGATPAVSDLVITKTGEVFVTFVSGHAGHLNTIGYYTYQTNNPPQTADEITEIHYIFPNASLPGQGGNLQPGSKVNLGTFSPGTSIGFVLLSDAYNYSSQSIRPDRLKFYSTSSCSPETNPDLRKHTVLLAAPQYLFCIGFNDQDRKKPGYDTNFDDVIIYAGSNVAGAISNSGVAPVDKNLKR